ncbi:M23 family peptidase [Roseomonas sp. M0104]|uniref:M23 family peptidase n=1 Tax=Teichococcus coralli TaxID=2545983 RepID=A0A845BHN4_9PROT|nr:M23 family metallopeptidase [Pseudoroseomonas coralli]MXP65656.1 M23 family peptidase [Pseudoroseomonas coralli]
MIGRRLILGAPALLLGACAAGGEPATAAAPGPLLDLPPQGLTQGGFVVGRVPPGSRVTLDGRPISVGREGRFALGFGRDAAPEAQIAVAAPDGRAEARPLAIARRDWDIQRLAGLPPKMVTPDAKQLARIKAEQARLNALRKTDSSLPHFAEPFDWPARGRISGVYGSQRILNGEPRAPHLGLDVAVPTGTPCAAMGGGRVLLADNLYFTGNTVLLDHGHGLVSLYAHLSRMEVAEGAMLACGQQLGETGATGRVTGPHLHLGLYWFTTAVDPRPLLPA